MIDLHPLFRLELRRWQWRRALGYSTGLYLLSVVLAAGLQGLWAGDSLYNGAGPALAERWFFSFAVTQAPGLAVWAAVAGVAMWRRLSRTGVLAHAMVSPLRPLGLLAGAGAAAAWPLVLWVAGSCLFWGIVAAILGAPGLPGVLFAHALLLAQGLAFGLMGAAIGCGFRSGAFGLNKDAQDRQDEGLAPRSQSSCASCASLLSPKPEARNLAAVGLAGAGMLVAWTALFAVGPLLERISRPEGLIYGVLLVNPYVAMGTALNLDVLRTPWIYQWTAIPEYRFAYPAPVGTLALYLGGAFLAVCAASRTLEPD